jgi:hypothetical protein
MSKVLFAQHASADLGASLRPISRWSRGAALVDCCRDETVRSRAQKPLDGFLIHASSGGRRYPLPPW